MARHGGEEQCAEEFGGALMAACKVKELILEHVSGDAMAVSEAARAMMAHMQAKSGSNGNTQLRLQAAGKPDVLAAARSLPEKERGGPGEVRMPEFGLGELPVAGLSVLISLIAADPKITAISLPKNGLTEAMAEALIKGASRHGSSISRLKSILILVSIKPIKRFVKSTKFLQEF